jgi:uncharacterized membrane protein
MKMIIIAGLLLAAPAAAHAQQAAAGTSTAGQAAASKMSEAGATLFRNYQTSQRAELLPLFKQRAELQAQFDGLLKPGTFDDSKLEATMIQLRQVEGQIVEKQGTALLALLRAMTAQDRNEFLALMSQSPPVSASRARTPQAGTGR